MLSGQGVGGLAEQLLGLARAFSYSACTVAASERSRSAVSMSSAMRSWRSSSTSAIRGSATFDMIT